MALRKADKQPVRRWRQLPDGSIRYRADIDWSRYTDRVTELIQLHKRAYVHHILCWGDGDYFLFADGYPRRLDPDTLIYWATHDGLERPPDGTWLSLALHDLHEAFEEEKRERADPFTWVDFLHVYWPMMPENIVVQDGDSVTLDIPVCHLSEWDIRNTVDALHAALPRRCNGSLAFSYNWITEPRPADVPVLASLTVTGNPGKKAIRDALREAMRLCPTQGQPPEMPYTIPPQRAYLIHMREETFRADLERYKRWAYGFSFRQIAYIEQCEREGGILNLSVVPYTVGGKAVPEKIGFPTRGESAVRKSVVRTYEAIYLAPYDEAKSYRTQFPRSLPAYNCPEHGPHCCPLRNVYTGGPGCAYLMRWPKRAIPDLPTEDTGKLPNELLLIENLTPSVEWEDGLASGWEAESPVFGTVLADFEQFFEDSGEGHIHDRKARPSLDEIPEEADEDDMHDRVEQALPFLRNFALGLGPNRSLEQVCALTGLTPAQLKQFRKAMQQS